LRGMGWGVDLFGKKVSEFTRNTWWVYWKALTITVLLSYSPGTTAESKTDGESPGKKARMPAGSAICGKKIHLELALRKVKEIRAHLANKKRHQLTFRANVLIPAISPIFKPPTTINLLPFATSSSINSCSTGRQRRQCTSLSWLSLARRAVGWMLPIPTSGLSYVGEGFVVVVISRTTLVIWGGANCLTGLLYGCSAQPRSVVNLETSPPDEGSWSWSWILISTSTSFWMVVWNFAVLGSSLARTVGTRFVEESCDAQQPPASSRWPAS